MLEPLSARSVSGSGESVRIKRGTSKKEKSPIKSVHNVVSKAAESPSIVVSDPELGKKKKKEKPCDSKKTSPIVQNPSETRTLKAAHPRSGGRVTCPIKGRNTNKKYKIETGGEVD